MEVVSVRDSERNPESYSGDTQSRRNPASTDNDPLFRCPHGKEPHQHDLGQHPAHDYIGTVDDPDDPQMYQLHQRDATAEQLIHEVIEISEHAVVDLGEMQ